MLSSLQYLDLTCEACVKLWIRRYVYASLVFTFLNKINISLDMKERGISYKGNEKFIDNLLQPNLDIK